MAQRQGCERITFCNSPLDLDVIIKGDTLFVGNPAQNRVDIFTYDGAVWTLADSLRGPDTDAGDEFGTAIVIHKSRVLVGAPKADGDVLPGSGAGYIFRKQGTQFLFEGKIVPEIEQLNTNFGKAMDMDSVPGDRLGIAMGMSGVDFGTVLGAGGVVLFYHNGIRWKGGTILTDNHLKPGGQFGTNVHLDSIWLVVSSLRTGPEPYEQESKIYRDSIGHYVYWKTISSGQVSFFEAGELLYHQTLYWDDFDNEYIKSYFFDGELVAEAGGLIVPEFSRLFASSWQERFSINAIQRLGNRMYAGLPSSQSDKRVRSGVVQIHEKIEIVPFYHKWTLVDLIYPNQWHVDTAFSSSTTYKVWNFGNNVSVSGDFLATAARLTGDSAAVFVYDLNDRCRAPFVTEIRLGTLADSFAFLAKWKPIANAVNYNFGLIWPVQDNHQLNWTTTDTFFMMPKSELPYGKYTWRIQSNCGDRQSDYRRKDLFVAPSPCGTATNLALSSYPPDSNSLMLTWEHAGIRGAGKYYINVINSDGATVHTGDVHASNPKRRVVPKPPSAETYIYKVRPSCTSVATEWAFTQPHAVIEFPPDDTGIALTPRNSEAGWTLFSLDGRLVAEGTGTLVGLPNGIATGCYLVRTQNDSGMRCWP